MRIQIKKSKIMRLATTTGDFLGYTSSQMKAVKYISSAGFRYLDYSFGMDYNNHKGIFSDAWEAYLNDLIRLADCLQVEFVQAHAPLGMPLIQNAERDDLIAATKHGIRCCAALGIKNVVVHSGYEAGLSREETFEKNKAFYMELLRCAERYGVNVLTENFNRMWIEDIYWVDSAADLKALVEFVDHPLFHACWDIGHGNMLETPQDEALRILGSDVYALHVQDNLGDKDTHSAPYFGTTNFDSVMHGLSEIGYEGYFTFEANNILPRGDNRRPFHKENRLCRAPLGLRIQAEKFLYEIGKYILSEYDCFEE